MTTRLTQALGTLAEQAPPPPSGDLWAAGRRLRRNRRWRRALAGLATVAVLLVAVPPMLTEHPAPQFGEGGITLPASLAQPHLWQQRLSADPNGPALLVFATEHSITAETASVVVGRDGSYRMIYPRPGSDVGVLSPDGRYLLGTFLIDLTTGRSRPVAPGFADGVAWYWAPDSRHVVGIRKYGSGEVAVVDVVTGTSRVLASTRASDEPRGAVSPDGTRVAVMTGEPGGASRLLVLDLATGRTEVDVPLLGGRTLAGPAAWTPDGRYLLFTSAPAGTCGAMGCAVDPPPAGAVLRVERIDPISGATADVADYVVDRFSDVVGWRDGDPVVQVRTGGDTTWRCHLAVLEPTGTRELPLQVPDRECPQLPADVLETATFGGPPLAPSPWQAQWWFYALLACPALTALAVALLVARASGRARKIRRVART